jgi:Zn-dependent alcohol dehydrogenase
VRIRAAVCRAFGEDLSVETVELAPPGPGEVRVKLAACAICHSDILFARGAWGGTPPLVLGHEAAGVVAETGAGVTTVAVGDHVVVALIRCCGGCHYCTRGEQVLCEAVFPLDRTSPLTDAAGAPLGHGLRTAAFAEQVVVEASQVARIDPAIDLQAASLLACGVITGVGAVINTARMPPGSNAVVVGVGGVGLNTVQGAVLAGAARIIALDVVASKLERARAFGATDTVNSATEDAAAAIRALTEGRGADYVFVTVGAAAAFDQAFDYITKAGTVVIVGMPPSGVFARYDPGTLAAWNQRVIGSKMGSTRLARDVPMLAGFHQQGRLKLDELITGRYPLDRINEAIASAAAGEALRNVIVFP